MKKNEEVKIYPLRISEKEQEALGEISKHIGKDFPGMSRTIRDLIRISIFYYAESIRRLKK